MVGLLTPGAPLFILLLPAAAALMVVGCRLAGDDLRAAVLRGFVLFGIVVGFSTEALSVFDRLDRLTLAVFWLAACVCAGLVIALLRRRHFKLGTSSQSSESGILPQPSSVERLCAIGIIATLAPVALVAIAGAPNVADVMGYHMPRIVFWSQARSIAFFPTSFQQQILLQPFNEYLQLHTYLLAGGDRFVCIVQWFAFAGCLLGVSLLAERLGAGREGQLLTALACATIPMGILQASGAKNDLTLTFLLIAAAYFGVVWMQRGRILDLWTLSAAFALALFTKGTAYIIAPALLAGTIIAAAPLRWRRLAATVLPVIAATLVINGPQYLRCYRHGESPFGPATAYADGYGRFANDKLGVPVILSNAVRNAGLHFNGLPGTTRLVYAIHRVLGIDPADPATTWPGTRFEDLPPVCERNEACAPSTIHVILLLLAIPVVCWLCIRRADRLLFLYCAGIVASFVLFCALLRWQPWNSRLHLGFLIPGAVVIGMLLSRVTSASVKIMLCVVLLIQAQLFVCRSSQHPLVSRGSVLIKSREHQYFYDSLGVGESAYSNAVDYVRRLGCSNVGIDNSFEPTVRTSSTKWWTSNTFRLPPVEYQMLALLKERIPGVRFIHVGVHDRSAQYTKGLPFASPCAIICLKCASDPQKSAQYRSAAEPAVFDPVVVFSRAMDSGARLDPVRLSH